MPEVADGPAAPALSRRRPRAHAVDGSAPVFSAAEWVTYVALAALWGLVGLRFWSFWLAPAHRGSLGLYVPATIALAYVSTGLPTFFWFYVGRMRRPVAAPAPPGLRVAMITPCVPSHESLEVIEGQLRALLEVEYPHDSWILDEGADREVERLAGKLGVNYFTRKGVHWWNELMPPFQKKTKAGNVNSWLDHVSITGDDYDCFVQLDIDHRPRPDYLHRTLGHFNDPDVAWVQAPSVCHNLDSWTARGQAEQDLVLQGPLQMGFYGHCSTPFIIGSHTTYRTSAIRGIGGYQPTRAEDHLDTVVLAAAGHRGVYVPEIIASGDGPEDLSTYLAQQFAWAYSMVQILLQHTPRLVRHYRVCQAFQFLMAQSWYFMWSISLAVLWFLPIVALLSGHAITRTPLLEFLSYYLALICAAGLMWCWCRPWFQPGSVRLSWRAFILETARWPVVLWAVINAVLGVKRPYMITPKGSGKVGAPSGLRPYGPYFALVALGVGAVFAFQLGVGRPPQQGYLALVLLNVALVLVLLLVAVGLEMSSLRKGMGGIARAAFGRRRVVAALFATCAAIALATASAWAPMVHSLQ
jgi:cellulose synthase (UDP-forming)